MRLDFNIVFIDDDKNDRRSNREILQLITKIEEHISKKGFNPSTNFFASTSEINNLSLSQLRRVDLYLSDNNLSNNSEQNNLNEQNGGIDLYLDLKGKFICDFVLYTRSDKLDIVNKLATNLLEKQDPNLFSRFSFVARDANRIWHKQILKTIDHIITKREEINNLRGIYSHKLSKIDLHLRSICNINNSRLNLKGVLDKALELNKIDILLWKKITTLRLIRNSLCHKDEYFDTENLFYVIDIELPEFDSLNGYIKKNLSLNENSPQIEEYRNNLKDITNSVLCLS